MPARPGFEATENGVIVPSGVTRTILSVPTSMNHTLPSGPRVIACGWSPPEIGNSLIVGAAHALGVAIATTSPAATAAPSSLAR